MVHRSRIKYTTEKMALIWNCWKEGQSLRGIGRLFDRHSSSVYGLISRTGGIRPPERVRSKHALSLSEREEISRGIAFQLSLRGIAAMLVRSPSTISREVRRNGGLENYRATLAEDAAWTRSCRPKCCKLASSPKLCKIIGDNLPWQLRLKCIYVIQAALGSEVQMKIQIDY